MTLDEFRATRREVDDLAKEMDGVDMWDDVTAGYVYTFTHGTDEGDFYIERTKDGQVYLLLERSDWLEPVEKLPDLEAILFNWAHDEMVPKDER